MSSTGSSSSGGVAGAGGSAVFVEVETVNEDDDDDTSINSGTSITDASVSPSSLGQRQQKQQQEELFEDEVVVQVESTNNRRRGLRDGNNTNPPSGAETRDAADAAAATPSLNSSPGFIPDPDEWLNVVNTAADTFMGAASSNNTNTTPGDGSSSDDLYYYDNGLLLPHPDELKVGTASSTTRKATTTGTTNFDNDEPDHDTPFVNVIGEGGGGGGGISLPSTKEEVQGGVSANYGFNVNSTDHSSSLPHVDEIKKFDENNTIKTSAATAAATATATDEPVHQDFLQMNTVGVGSLPSNTEEVVGGVGENHGFNVNSTGHAASLPHVDEYRSDNAAGATSSSGSRHDDEILNEDATGSLLFVPNTTGVDSLPEPGDDVDGKQFQVNSTGHGASLPHVEEVKGRTISGNGGGGGGSGTGGRNKKTKKHTGNKKPSTSRSNNNGVDGGDDDSTNKEDGLDLNMTILDYDSDKDPAEKKDRVYGIDGDTDYHDEPDHDTPHAVQSRSGDHGSSLPHPEELQTDTNTTKKSGRRTNSSIAAATSKFFSSIVRVNSKDEEYVDDDDDEGLTGEAEMTSMSAPDKKRKKNKKRKKSKKDKRTKKNSSTRRIEDDDDDGDDRFMDEPGAQAAIEVTRRNVEFNIDSDSDDKEENGGLEHAGANSKAIVRYDPPTSQLDGVFLKRARSSTGGSHSTLRSNSLVKSIRGISSRMGFDSNHEPTHRMDDEDHVEFGLSLEDDDDDDSFYLKNDAKRHYRTAMIMRHKKTCIIVGLIVLFLVLLIPLAILSSEKRKGQLNTVDTSSIAAPPTPAPTTEDVPAAPSAAPTLPPVAENCQDRISLAQEMAGRDCYGPDEFINITFTQCYPSPDDWIGLFPSGAVYFGRLWREYYNWIWTCGAEPCTEQQVTEDLPIRGKFSTPMLDPGDYQLFIVLDSGWPYLPLVSSEVIRVRTWCSTADDAPETTPSDGIRGRQLRG